jgi:hypothetical protein
MWNKILEINWKKRFGDPDANQPPADEPIEGTNGATIAKMKGVNEIIRSFLSAVEIPVFGAAVLAILIIGEKNFFSGPVNYQTEPIASVGKYSLSFAICRLLTSSQANGHQSLVLDSPC